jgi:hypothetical protein
MAINADLSIIANTESVSASHCSALEKVTAMKVTLKHALATTILMLSLAVPVAAMDISIQQLPDGAHMVSAKGPIVAGDFDRLRVALRSVERDRWGNKDISLNSGGGLVGEALAMAALIDQEKVSTYVLDGAECASACAQIVFLSGVYRVVFDGGRLGIHSCSEEGFRNGLCNQQIAENAFKHGIPYGSVMAFMEQRGPSDMAWFDSRDADCWGFTRWPSEYQRGIKPGEPAPCVIKAFECAKREWQGNSACR